MKTKIIIEVESDYYDNPEQAAEYFRIIRPNTFRVTSAEVVKKNDDAISCGRCEYVELYQDEAPCETCIILSNFTPKKSGGGE